MGYTLYQSVNKEMDLANVYYVTPSVLTVTFVSLKIFCGCEGKFKGSISLLHADVNSCSDFGWHEARNPFICLAVSVLVSTGDLRSFHVSDKNRICH